MPVKNGNNKNKSNNNNSEIAKLFYEMADMLQIKNIKWKPQAYIIAGQTLESLKKDVSEIYGKEQKKGLTDLPGIGEALADKIIEYLKTKEIHEHDKLKQSIAPGLYEMMRIPGVGAKKAVFFYEKLNIKTIDELARAAEEHILSKFPGFKERSEQKILESIELMKKEKSRIPWKEASVIANKVLREVKKIPNIKESIVAGSFRRRKSTIGDLDIVIRTPNPELILKNIVKMNFVASILGIGNEKATVITKDGMQIDFRVFTDKEFGAGLLYFTGDKQHNIWLRKIAIKHGWKLNEYGLFNKAGKRIAGKTEEEIYNKLGVKMPIPENRIGKTE